MSPVCLPACRHPLPQAFNQSAANSKAAPEPIVATITIGLIIAALSCWGDLFAMWSLSAAGVLIYYALTNLAALRLAPEHRRFPRVISWLGLIICVGLIPSLDSQSLYLAATLVICIAGSTILRSRAKTV